MRQDFLDSIKNCIQREMEDLLHTSAKARVERVEENHTAELTPDLSVCTDDGKEVPYPKISGVTILMPCGADGTIGFAFPVKVGDGCVALFGEGGTGKDLKWDLSNALLMPGCHEDAGEQVKRAGDEDAAVMFAPTATITVKKDCIELKKQDTTVTMKDDSIVVQRGSSKINVTSSEVEISTSTVDVTGNVKVEGNIQVQGNVTISGLLTLGGIVMNTHTHIGTHGVTGGPL